MSNETTIARFLPKIEIMDSGCWEWRACISNGYPQFMVDKKLVGAHRYSYELFREKIPAGLQIDHLCRNKICVNPEHLEVVTNRENVLRGIGVTANNARKTHCPQGHPYDNKNTYINPDGQRLCRICARANQVKHRGKMRLLGVRA